MREPGASEVLMCGLTLSPASTAFLAKRPAASSTLGLLVLVQLVMAAISTSPLPTVTSPVRLACCAGTSACAAASVGLFCSISTMNRGAPDGAGTSAGAPTSTGVSLARTWWRVCSSSAGRLKPFCALGLLNRSANWLQTLPSSMRSCGRLGPARLGVTLPRSSFTTCE
ncbi:hypothetical protein D3C71_1564040 [compost metagenome]